MRSMSTFRLPPPVAPHVALYPPGVDLYFPVEESWLSRIRVYVNFSHVTTFEVVREPPPLQREAGYHP